MKKILFLICLLASSAISFSQVVKFKITSVSFRDYDETTETWDEWSEGKELNILGFIDSENERVKIFSETEQNYDVIENKGERTDNDGDDVVEWICVNEDGVKCSLKLITINSQDKRKQLYINFNNFMLVYNFYFLE
ncbi:hypothetical protein ERX46_02815 [Brumimicrobium glaciale]|uniref:Uncharacterized protein n=1 Tax=Brumimicrobium glaciale TaxID=200475 RepID=A0A4Q4KRL4_9FLAO|nr:hypothetical protein [Brumimicrobium glaciale]RYM35943.1 hypothetical protein ERX46_02815 [Brumimicrobium glaciale]